MRSNQVNSPALVGLIVAAIVAAVIGVPLLGKVNPTVPLAVALGSYDAAVTAADAYVTACAEKQIPQTCVPTAKVVVASVDATKKAYADLKQYGANPPATVAAAFTAAFKVLQDAVPASY